MFISSKLIKRLCICFVVCLIFLLSGCSKSAEIERLKIDVEIANRQVQGVVDEYNKNINSINEFNNLFFDGLKDTTKYNDSVEKFSPNRLILDTITEINYQLVQRNTTETDNIESALITDIKSYSFMKDDGSVVEMVTIGTRNINVLMEINWKNGCIDGYDYSFERW